MAQGPGRGGRSPSGRRARRRGTAALVVALGALSIAAACGTSLRADAPAAERGHGTGHHGLHTARATQGTSTTTSAPATTTTSSTPSANSTTSTTSPVPATSGTLQAPAPVGPGQHGPITSPPLPAPGPGFVAGRVTAIGDSVMIDYEQALEADIPGIDVTASVSRWWTQGESILESLKAQGSLGAVVIVGLATNGPVSGAQFDSMMQVLSGASRVVFVNTHVDRTWQGPNNAVLAAGVARYPRAVLADWYSLAQENPGWLYSTQTHLPIDGPGAQALAALVADAA